MIKQLLLRYLQRNCSYFLSQIQLLKLKVLWTFFWHFFLTNMNINLVLHKIFSQNMAAQFLFWNIDSEIFSYMQCILCVKKCIGLFLEYTFQRNVRVVLEKHTTNFYKTLLLSSFWPSLKTIIHISICEFGPNHLQFCK